MFSRNVGGIYLDSWSDNWSSYTGRTDNDVWSFNNGGVLGVGDGNFRFDNRSMFDGSDSDSWVNLRRSIARCINDHMGLKSGFFGHKRGINVDTRLNNDWLGVLVRGVGMDIRIERNWGRVDSFGLHLDSWLDNSSELCL